MLDHLDLSVKLSKNMSKKYFYNYISHVSCIKNDTQHVIKGYEVFLLVYSLLNYYYMVKNEI